MRVMVFVKATEDSEQGMTPSPELDQMFLDMGKFNEELVKAGVMLAGEGLHPSSKGARVRFSGSKRTVIDGPFSETKELVAGFWILQVKSKEEVIEWVKRCPNPMPGESEIEITGGLKEGQEVITGPSRVMRTLKDGATVKKQTGKPGGNANTSEAK